MNSCNGPKAKFIDSSRSKGLIRATLFSISLFAKEFQSITDNCAFLCVGGHFIIVHLAPGLCPLPKLCMQCWLILTLAMFVHRSLAYLAGSPARMLACTSTTRCFARRRILNNIKRSQEKAFDLASEDVMEEDIVLSGDKGLPPLKPSMSFFSVLPTVIQSNFMFCPYSHH